MARTLVIHPGALGDVLLAIPAVRSLRCLDRDDEIVLAAQSHIASLVRDLGEVDGHVRFDALGLDALFTERGSPAGLRALGHVDRAVCWFGARDPEFARRLREIVPGAIVASSVPAASAGDSSTEAAAVWKHLVTTATGGQSRSESCAAQGSPHDPVSPHHAFVRVPPALADAGRRALEAAGWDGRPLLLAHPGASGPAKRWPVDGFTRVLRRFTDRFTIVVHEGPTDHEPARALIADLGGSVLHLGHPSLALLAGALVHADAYLGNDSGVSHLAASVGVPSVVLFRHEWLPWVPWAPGVEIAADRDERVVSRALERLLARGRPRASSATAAAGLRRSDA